MVKCAGCGESVKRSKTIKENLDGKDFMFCCKGCRELFLIKMQGLDKDKQFEGRLKLDKLKDNR